MSEKPYYMNSIRTLHARKAASEEGTVPGSGVAFVRAIKALHRLKLQDDEAVGLTIVCRALEGRGT
jgi:chaperonin GroEL